MKLVITGNLDEGYMEEAIGNTLDKYMVNLAENAPETFKEISDSIKGVHILELALTLSFDIEGQDEPVVMTVDPAGDGVEELLVITAEVDEKGKVIDGTLEDNENESLFSEEQAKLALGLQKDFKPIKSQFGVLLTKRIIKLDDSWKVRLANKIGSDGMPKENTVIVQYLQDGILVQELEIDLAETDKTFHDVEDHFIAVED